MSAFAPRIALLLFAGIAANGRQHDGNREREPREKSSLNGTDEFDHTTRRLWPISTSL